MMDINASGTKETSVNSQSKQVSVDVIIPTCHPDEKFSKLLSFMSRQTVKPRHIYVINTEQAYFPEDVGNGMSNLTVTHITKQEFDHGGTRNQGAALSDADFLLFMTQDAVPMDENLIAALLQPFEDSTVGAAYARQLADPRDNFLEYYTRMFNYPEVSQKKTIKDIERLGIKTFFCSNVCAMYRRSAYEEQGGFVEKAIFNEDMMMAASLVEAGYAIYYAADAKVMHYHNYSAIEQMRRNFDVAVSQQMAGGLFTKVKSEKEGVRLVLKTCEYMLKNGRFYLIPKVIWQSAFKFLGYKLGQNYQKLSKKQIQKISLNPSFWDKEFIS